MLNQNPEILIVDEGLTSEEILGEAWTDENGEVIRVNELAAGLLAASPASLGMLLADNQNLAEQTVNGIERLIIQKVWDATPDELEQIVAESKEEGVWNSRVKQAVMRRNEQQRTAILECQNLEAMDLMLSSMAKQDGWLPRPVYQAAAENVRGRIATATMTELDELSDFASQWRFKHSVLQDIKDRDAALIQKAKLSELVLDDGTSLGYRLKTEVRQMLIQDARKALRMVDSGEWELMK